jgi:transcriptional regulator with XRE-family HTH domain
MAYQNFCGPFIQEARLARGWTETDLARELEIAELGLNEEVIGQIERRERKVNDEELILIAAALGVPIQSLVPKQTGSQHSQ